MNRLLPIILIISTTTSFIVESQRNFLDLLESIQTNETTTTSTTTTETPESSSKTYPKQRSRARYEIREKYESLLSELENSVNDEYYENIEGIDDGEGSGEEDYYYYFDYEEVPKSDVDETNKFPELSRLLSNTDEFFEADERFKSRDSIKKKKRRVKRNTLGFPKHHHMDHVGYRPPHYMEGVDFTLETVFGLPMAEYYVSRYGVHTPMDSMPNHGYSAPKTSYSVEPTYHEPILKKPAPKYKEPEYHEPIKPEYHEPIKPKYHEPMKPEYHPPQPKYKTSEYHEPPKLDYIIPKKPTYSVSKYHDPQLDYSVPKKPGIVLPLKKKVSSNYEEEYYNVKPKYQTPIFYSSKSPHSPRPQLFNPKKVLQRPSKVSSAEENGYAIYYLPYDQYVLEYPEYGLNPRVPTLPGNAHFLVASPHRPPSLAGRRKKRSVPVEGVGHQKNPKVSKSSRRNKNAKKLGGLLKKLTSSILHPKRNRKNNRIRNNKSNSFNSIPTRNKNPSYPQNPPPSISLDSNQPNHPIQQNEDHLTTILLSPSVITSSYPNIHNSQESTKTTIYTFESSPKLTGIKTYDRDPFISNSPSLNPSSSYGGSSQQNNQYSASNNQGSQITLQSSNFGSNNAYSSPSSFGNTNAQSLGSSFSRPDAYSSSVSQFPASSTFISSGYGLNNNPGFSSTSNGGSSVSSNGQIFYNPSYSTNNQNLNSIPFGQSTYSNSGNTFTNSNNYNSGFVNSQSFSNSAPSNSNRGYSNQNLYNNNGPFSPSYEGVNPFLNTKVNSRTSTSSNFKVQKSRIVPTTTATTTTLSTINEITSSTESVVNKLESAKRILDDLSSSEIRRVLRQVDFEDDIERSIIEGKWIVKRRRKKSDSSFRDDEDSDFISVFDRSPVLDQINKLKRISLNINRVVKETENLIRRRGSLSLVDLRLLRTLRRKEKKVDTLIELLTRKDVDDEDSVNKVLSSLKESGIRHPSGEPWTFQLVQSFLKELKERSTTGDSNIGNTDLGLNDTLEENLRKESAIKSRKNALLRASEKQQLILSNLSDAIRRQKDFNETKSSEFNLVESFLSRQSNELDSFKSTIVSLDEKSSTEDRLLFLEDTSHRQLEILEFLMDTVSELQSKSSESLQKISRLEELIRNGNATKTRLEESKLDTSEEESGEIEEEGIEDLDVSPSSRLTLSTESDPSDRAGTWYRRFYDNYRLGLLQNRIRKQKSPNFN